jgi:hypothetical protein
MFNRVFAVCIASTLGLATVPIEVSAKGLGLHKSHGAFGHKHHRHHRLHGGFFAGYGLGIQPVGDVSTPQLLGPVIPPLILHCRHSQDIFTVPSEEGGTRQITVTRC